MRRLAIIHFQPLELYPPIQNFLNFLGEQKIDSKVSVFTNSRVDDNEKFSSSCGNIFISRLARTGNKLFWFARYSNYVIFYLQCLIKLIYYRPDKILYYETISCLPAYLYKRYFNSKVVIFIHYHEYTSPEEYKHGMKLVKYFYKLEKWMLPRSSWVSHTNDFRMASFLKDSGSILVPSCHILPNYPPRSWLNLSTKAVTMPIRIVYVGALSLRSMYTIEFIDWVQEQRGKVVWDIYSANIDKEAEQYLSNLNSIWINFMNQVPYKTLPDVLSGYNVGVILYKGVSFNHIYSVPNKLFEYLACGLDVWFPDKILGSLSLVNHNVSPKILAFDFLKLEEINLEMTIDKSNCVLQATHFFSDTAYQELYKNLFNV